MEQQDWSTCYAKFKSTQTIYSSLSATLPADEADIYAEFSSELEPSLRYCQYNMGESGDTDNVADLLKGKGILNLFVKFQIIPFQKKFKVSIFEFFKRVIL